MTEKTKTANDGESTLPRVAWLIAGVVGVFAYFFGLTLPFVGPDEPRYAQVAREMFERGDWITPTLGGVPWFEKPPLLYWFEIISFKIIGVSEFAARLGPALCGLGIVACMWLLARIARGKDFANWLALLSASTLGIYVFSHGASFDIVITFCITAALTGFYVSDRLRGNASLAGLFAFYAFVGLALLAKGLIGLFLPAAVAGSYLLIEWRRPSRTFFFSVLWGLPVVAIIAATWYLPMYMRHGYRFIDEFIVQHHFQRFLTNKYQHPQPFYFFLWVLPLMTLPWLPAWLAVVWRSPRTERDSHSMSNFSLAWLLIPLLFFSFSGSKLPGYVLPAVPGAIVLYAQWLYPRVRSDGRWLWSIYGAACGVFVVCISLLAFVVPRVAEAETVKGLFQAASDRGFGHERVLSLHTVSHNAEFYAAGRLLRSPDGQQKKLYGPGEVATEMERSGEHRVLVLVPNEYVGQLTSYQPLATEVIGTNGELSLVSVERR